MEIVWFVEKGQTCLLEEIDKLISAFCTGQADQLKGKRISSCFLLLMLSLLLLLLNFNHATSFHFSFNLDKMTDNELYAEKLDYKRTPMDFIDHLWQLLSRE